MDFNIRKGLSHNTHIFYKFDMSDKYDEAEYFCYGKGFSIDETPSATICKRLIPGTTMS
jgi:hypothetical protein